MTLSPDDRPPASATEPVRRPMSEAMKTALALVFGLTFGMAFGLALAIDPHLLLLAVLAWGFTGGELW